jgi:hypothetical protein
LTAESGTVGGPWPLDGMALITKSEGERRWWSRHRSQKNGQWREVGRKRKKVACQVLMQHTRHSGEVLSILTQSSASC